MAELRPTILLVEDEPEIRRFLRTSLGSEGFRMVESATGRRGSIDAATHKPDVAIVDLGLPDGNGLDLVALAEDAREDRDRLSRLAAEQAVDQDVLRAGQAPIAS